MATQETRAELITIVVAMFDAAPGVAVLSDLTAASDAGNSNTAIAASLANSAEFKSIFPTFQTNAEFVSKFVDQMVGSLVSEAEKTTVKTALTAEMNAGATRVDVVLTAVAALKAIPTTDTVWGNASAAFTNKVEVATYHTVEKQQPTTSLADLQAELATVDNTAASVTSAKAELDGEAAAGQTFTLTTGVDNVTGTVANDTISAVVATSGATLSAADQVDGGAGTDTLNLTADTAGASAIPATFFKNVEIANVRNVSGNDQTLNGANFDSESQVWSDRSTSKVIVTNLAAGATAGLKGSGSNVAFDFGYATASSAATLAVADGVAGGAVDITSAPTSVTVSSSGAANTIGALTLGGSATALTINATTNLTTSGITQFTGTSGKITATGAGNVSIGTLENTTVKTVDASGLSGKLTTTLNSNAGIVVTGGSGDDTITTGAVLAGTASVDAGAGTDTLVVADDAHITATSGAKYKSFETVRLTEASGTLDVSNLATNNTITAVQSGSTGLTFNNLNATQAGNVQVVADGAVLTLGVKDAGTVGQLDTVKVIMSATNAARTLTNVVASDVETVEIMASTGTGTATVSAFNHQDTNKIILSGSSALSFTTATSNANINSQIDGSAATGKLTIDAGNTGTNGLKITGGSADDTITGTGQADVIVGGAGKDKITGGVGADTLTGGADADTFIFANTATGLPSATNFDTITDFAKGSDIIDGPAALTISTSATASVGTAAINAEGIATFVAADDTLAEKLTAVAAGVEVATATTANDIAIFEHSGDSYVFISDATAGLSATDVLIKLTGVTGLTDSTITSGDLTIA
ncbi:beta strand repeat-containing protein [Pseudohongiella sp.]|uniref:beta strand repeat-containing protein n=1 Tax=Pseudohongiella sp. TaxID=1979412 RepID=UPI00178F1ABC|nr:calcium-binding protein [Pseudohongiella sp.]HDZ08734.1 calcium-binding protein [Pseudohongiella sp.]HEA62350.1 calcium-binding protein [Pseudohongiella sp.]